MNEFASEEPVAKSKPVIASKEETVTTSNSYEKSKLHIALQRSRFKAVI